MAEAVRTTCPYCGVGCGVLVTPQPGGGYDVKGDPDHPANFGRLCSKGSALGETLSDDGRLTQPVVDGQTATWDDALDRVADEFKAVIAEHGPDAVAFYVSGQLMTEAYYVANKLMKGYIGSANIDTNSRLCMASSVAGHKRAFGSDTVPGTYEDLDLADLVVLVGSNLSWCHPVLYQRLAAARKERGTKVIVIDPRKTATCDIADLHLAVKPGTDVKLFNGLLTHIEGLGSTDTDYVERFTEGAEQAIEAALYDAPDIRAVAETCGLDPADILDFFKTFRQTEKVVTVYSQGVNQSTQGTDKVNAIVNCHLLTGRIGKPGCGPLSVTGQPNAMGGREVGGLANTLAAHMDFDEQSVDLVQRFWGAPNIATRPGLKAVDMFEAVGSGRIKAIWVMATNPAVSMPNANRVRQALKDCPFVVVSDCVADTDTAAYAHVLLPATTWGERDGTVTNSERRISRQRPFKSAPGLAREDWAIVCNVAQRMGFSDGFNFAEPADIFSEHAALSRFENDGSRDFDLGELSTLDASGYDVLTPVQWPVRDGTGQDRFFADGGFFTPSQKGRLHAVRQQPPEPAVDPFFPLTLNTGRLRDQWHTMTRTGKSPRLTAHAEEPFVALHAQDAQRLNLEDGTIARVINGNGEALVRVTVDPGQRLGEVFMPIHWSHNNSSHGGVGALSSAATDPVSGQPDMKNVAVRIEPYGETWHALVVTRSSISLGRDIYWAQAQAGAHVRTMCAGVGKSDTAFTAFKAKFGDGEWIEFADPARGRLHAALMVNGRLEAAVFIAPHNIFPERAWLDDLFTAPETDVSQRQEILAGRAPGGQHDTGRIICSCLSVGLKTILRTLEDGRAVDVDSLGTVLGAGTNCGSCRPELQALVDTVMDAEHAGEEEQRAKVRMA